METTQFNISQDAEEKKKSQNSNLNRVQDLMTFSYLAKLGQLISITIYFCRDWLPQFDKHFDSWKFKATD